MKKLFLVMLMAILSLIFGSGCSVITKEQRRDIAAECGADTVCVAEKEDEIREDVMYERAARRLEEREEILELMLYCEAVDHVLWYTGRQSNAKRWARVRKDKYFIPSHASLMDYACLSRDETRRVLDRMLGKGF